MKIEWLCVAREGGHVTYGCEDIRQNEFAEQVNGKAGKKITSTRTHEQTAYEKAAKVFNCKIELVIVGVATTISATATTAAVIVDNNNELMHRTSYNK